jgi:hypothetical protein
MIDFKLNVGEDISRFFKIVRPRYYPEILFAPTIVNDSNRHMLERIAGLEFKADFYASYPPRRYDFIYALVTTPEDFIGNGEVDIEDVTNSFYMSYSRMNEGKFLRAIPLYKIEEVGVQVGMPLWLSPQSRAYFRDEDDFELNEPYAFGKHLDENKNQAIKFTSEPSPSFKVKE